MNPAIRYGRSIRFGIIGLILSALPCLIAGCTFSEVSRTPQRTDRPITVQGQGQTALDARQVQRLEGMMAPLIKVMDEPARLSQVRIGVSRDSDINAAYAGDGTFIVTTGLLEKASDQHLRGVLAHEIAHADLGHVAQTRAVGTGVQIGMIILDQILPGSGAITPLIADLGVMKPFSRGEEYKADIHGAEILSRAGYDGYRVMGDTLTWLMKTSGPSGGFFTTHPGTEDRIQRLISSAPSKR